jgi:RES domain-containing protein
VYTSESLALAALESLVNAGLDEVAEDLVALGVQLPDQVAVEHLGVEQLPGNWRAYPAPEDLAELGGRWVVERRTMVLRVPSVVVPSEFNYLLNPAHPDFRAIRVTVRERFVFDPRLRGRRR